MAVMWRIVRDWILGVCTSRSRCIDQAIGHVVRTDRECRAERFYARLRCIFPSLASSAVARRAAPTSRCTGDDALKATPQRPRR